MKTRWWLGFIGFAQPYRVSFAIVIVLSLLGAGFTMLAPWPLKLIVDYVLSDEPLPEILAWLTVLPGGGSGDALLGWLALATLLVFTSQQACQALRAYIQTGAATRMKFDLSVELFTHLQMLSLRYHYKKPTGDLVRRITADTDCVRDLVTGIALPLITAVTTLVVMFSIMWRLDSSLTLLALLAALPLPVLMKYLAPKMTETSYRQHEIQGELMALAERTMTALPVVQSFTREPREDQRYRGLSMRAIDSYLKTILSKLQYKVGVSTATALGTAAVMIIGGFHVHAGIITIGTLLVFLAYLGSMYGPLESIAYLSTSYADAAAGARRVLEVLDSEEMVEDSPTAQALPAASSGQGVTVRLEGVTFGYEPGRAVLDNITLEARPGETIALVGATGVGKSTLVSLIPRFFDPWEGRILVNGIDIRDVQLASLRAQVAMVLQESFLFPFSIAENIAYGRPEASQEEIVAAAIAANADEFIHKLPEGYDTIIGERGATLSGGQRQRLSIARALLKDAPILILDEPTSALDAETETLLLRAIERLMANRTTFIVAHRLSTIRNADRIAVLEDGKIVNNYARQEWLEHQGQTLSVTIESTSQDSGPTKR